MKCSDKFKKAAADSGHRRDRHRGSESNARNLILEGIQLKQLTDQIARVAS